MEDGALTGSEGLGCVSVWPPSVVCDIQRGIAGGGQSLEEKVATSW